MGLSSARNVLLETRLLVGLLVGLLVAEAAAALSLSPNGVGVKQLHAGEHRKYRDDDPQWQGSQMNIWFLPFGAPHTLMRKGMSDCIKKSRHFDCNTLDGYARGH